MQASGELMARAGWRGRLSGAAVVIGLALLAAGAVLLWQHHSAAPVYRYTVGEPVAAAELGALAAYARPDLPIRQVRLLATADDKPLAELSVAETADGPVLLDWRAKLDDPFLTLTVPPEDVTALAAVLERHVAQGHKLLAWWDSSRQFRLLSGVDTLFRQHLGIPLFVPAEWRGSRGAIEAVEQSFWRASAGAEQADEQARFQRFADALLMPEAEGMAALRALTDNEPAVLVLHLRDLILLGQMAPQKLGVAFQDFGEMTDVHGMIRRVHAWLDEHKYPAYGVLQAKGRPVRAMALTDVASSQTLAARLLPLMGNDQQDVAGATLVYQTGGFVVFEITPDKS